MAIQGFDDGLHIEAAERHDVDVRELQIGRHPDFRHRDDVLLEHRIRYGTPRQHFGHDVADQLADPQHAL